MKVKIGKSEATKGFVSDQKLFIKSIERIKHLTAFSSVYS